MVILEPTARRENLVSLEMPSRALREHRESKEKKETREPRDPQDKMVSPSRESPVPLDYLESLA